MAPDYLAGDCHLVANSGWRSLRSAERRDCIVPRQNSTFGDRSFAAAGPRAWNELPFSLCDTGLSLTTFNAHLKTYLFSTVFEATAHLWHLWFLCTTYKCTYLLTYLLTTQIQQISQDTCLTAYEDLRWGVQQIPNQAGAGPGWIWELKSAWSRSWTKFFSDHRTTQPIKQMASTMLSASVQFSVSFVVTLCQFLMTCGMAMQTPKQYNLKPGTISWCRCLKFGTDFAEIWVRTVLYFCSISYKTVATATYVA